jgi:YhcG PDDEXK nuclease domain
MAAHTVERHITGCATEELKNGAFKPEYAGKLSFYLSAVDGIMRTAVDGPSIGVLLCESRSGPIVEYTLQNIIQPRPTVSPANFPNRCKLKFHPSKTSKRWSKSCARK